MKRAVLASAMLAFAAGAGSMNWRVELDADLVEMRSSTEGIVPAYPGMELSGDPGSPLLPVLPVVLVLPAGARDISAEAVITGVEELPGHVSVRPAPLLRPLGPPGRQTAVADRSIYSSRAAWPADVIIGRHEGHLCGFTVLSLTVQPWRYIPSEGSLEICTGIDLEVGWREGEAPLLGPVQAGSAMRRMHSLVDNPEDLAAFSPPVRSALEGDKCWVAICDSSFLDVLEPLRLHWEQQGIPSSLVTVQEALSTHSGADDAERLRNAIRDLWEQNGTLFVLLAGDESLIPVRMVYSECESFVDIVPCDLYFSDLDGTWDGNGDGEYGQPEDGLDMYMDVLLARAPFSDSSEAQIFVDKTLGYSESPPGGSWSSTALLCGAMLFPDYGYTGGKGCDSLAAELPPSWNVVKIYENPSMAEGSDTQIAYLDSGTGWNYFAGHGNNRGVYWSWPPLSMITTFMADSLENGDRAGIHTSIGCYPGDFTDDECCAEGLLFNPDGGGISATFNTGVGWEGFWPELGVSEWLCILYTRAVFGDRLPTLGEAFASAKDQRVPLMHGGFDRNLQSLLAWSAFHDPALEPLGVPPDIHMQPVELSVSLPWPNPAMRDAPVTFDVDYAAGQASVSVHDISGRLVWSTSLGGPSTLQWDGCDEDGRRVPPGVYIISAHRGDRGAARLVTVLE